MMSKMQRKLGITLLGLVAFLVGAFGVSMRFVGPWGLVELVSYLLVVGGALAVLIGLVTAGLALVRR